MQVTLKLQTKLVFREGEGEGEQKEKGSKERGEMREWSPSLVGQCFAPVCTELSLLSECCNRKFL